MNSAFLDAIAIRSARGMFCSQARSQPACFSGRTGSSHSRQTWESLHFRPAALSQTAAQKEEEANTPARLSRVESAGHRGHNRGSNGSSSREREPVRNRQEVNGLKQRTVHNDSSRKGAVLKRKDTRPAALIMGSRDPATEEPMHVIYDEAVEVLASGELDDEGLARLVEAMGRVMMTVPMSTKRQLQAHRALHLVDHQLLPRIRALPDQKLVQIAVALASMETVGTQLDSPQLVAEELAGRQKGLQIGRVETSMLLRAIASAPSFQEKAQGLGEAIAKRFQVEHATHHELFTFLMFVARSGVPRKLHQVANGAAASLAKRRADLTIKEITSLMHYSEGLREVLPLEFLEGLADTLLEKDSTFSSCSNLADLLQGCCKGGLNHAAFSNAAAAALINKLPTSQDKAVVASLNALAKMEARITERVLVDLQQGLELHVFPSASLRRAKPWVSVMLVWSVTKLGIPPPAAFLDALLERSVQVELGGRADPFDPSRLPSKNMAVLVECLGRLQHVPPHPDSFFEALVRKLAVANAQDVAGFAGGVAKLSDVMAVPDRFWAALDRRAATLYKELTVQGMCRVLHSFAKCRVQPSLFLPVTFHRIKRSTAHLTLRDMSDLMYGFAMLKCGGRLAASAIRLMAERWQAILQSEGKYTVREVVQIAWAVATLDDIPLQRRKIIRELALLVEPETMNGLDMSYLLWAIAKYEVGFPRPNDLHQYTARIEEIALDLKPLQITTILWSYAKLEQHPGIELMEALLSPITAHLGQVDTQGVGNTIWACGKLRHHPGPLIQAVKADILKRGSQYSLTDWTSIIWGFSDLGEDPKDVLQLAHHSIEEQRLVPDGKLVSHILWAGATFEHYQQPFFQAMLRMLDDIPPQEVDEDVLKRIRQAHLLGCLVGVCNQRDVGDRYRMRGEVRDWLGPLLLEDQSHETTVQYERIKEALQQLNVPYISQFRVGKAEDELHQKVLKLSVMLKRPWGTHRMVVLDFLSPKKLTVNTHQPLGRVLHRTACLCACGYDVLWLPYSEWEIARTKKVEQEYLTSRIYRLLSKT